LPPPFGDPFKDSIGALAPDHHLDLGIASLTISSPHRLRGTMEILAQDFDPDPLVRICEGPRTRSGWGAMNQFSPAD
jgi:hypothetical protein